MRALAIIVGAFLLTSCVGGMFGDPVASTEYVVAGGGAERVGKIVRTVAAANDLELFRHRHPQPRYPYREYTDWAPGGQVSIWLTIDTRAPFIVSVSERYTAKRSAEHRKIARELEAELTRAGIPFHRPVGDELLTLQRQRDGNET